jgi:hypothetical protein
VNRVINNLSPVQLVDFGVIILENLGQTLPVVQIVVDAVVASLLDVDDIRPLRDALATAL